MDNEQQQKIALVNEMNNAAFQAVGQWVKSIASMVHLLDILNSPHFSDTEKTALELTLINLVQATHREKINPKLQQLDKLAEEYRND